MALTHVLKQESRLFFFTALCAALLIASTEPTTTKGLGVMATYAYWLLRILTEAFLFFAIRDVVEGYLLPNKSVIMTAVVAFVLSLIPFVLAITAFDLILGFPELGLENGDSTQPGRLGEFALELLYLSDNHFALCLLLSAPRLFKKLRNEATAQQGATFLETLEPKLKGDLLWITAQEHYVKITTSEETRTVLYRFSDLIRDLHAHPGMQIHRSHWIAFDAITDVEKSSQSMKVTLSSGAIIPVSRTYRSLLEDQLSKQV
ncbi:LytTR family transcriptional regulator DNA-binding domain-containing protein [Terasakiella sp. A23]|uniref:LytTR family DNA-binding domain-containing protein n=1 Tax=Terasakiella sp. FCG-A23 TaxID=3080561 RepID=UPI002952D48C|nr:LytTR family transcriptional regulator DNA-binding domain-containing protein [Terasakiella sp. A23]MDV7340082.1 LytTR family transcriptional regulator DNA-binding domain-containing protein [Terasakiella sp. A23]